jgi:hypothetical protein
MSSKNLVSPKQTTPPRDATTPEKKSKRTKDEIHPAVSNGFKFLQAIGSDSSKLRKCAVACGVDFSNGSVTICPVNYFEVILSAAKNVVTLELQSYLVIFRNIIYDHRDTFLKEGTPKWWDNLMNASVQLLAATAFHFYERETQQSQQQGNRVTDYKAFTNNCLGFLNKLKGTDGSIDALTTLFNDEQRNVNSAGTLVSITEDDPPLLELVTASSLSNVKKEDLQNYSLLEPQTNVNAQGIQKLEQEFTSLKKELHDLYEHFSSKYELIIGKVAVLERKTQQI